MHFNTASLLINFYFHCSPLLSLLKEALVIVYNMYITNVYSMAV